MIQCGMCTIHSGVHNSRLIYSKWKKKTKHLYPRFLLYQLPLTIFEVCKFTRFSPTMLNWKDFIISLIKLKKKTHFFSKLLLESLIELVVFVVSILYQRDWVKALWGSGMILFVYFNKDVSYQTLVEGYCFYEKIIIQ